MLFSLISIFIIDGLFRDDSSLLFAKLLVEFYALFMINFEGRLSLFAFLFVLVTFTGKINILETYDCYLCYYLHC